MTAINPARGEAEIQIDGQSYRLRLTLGALAELEALFQAGDLQALGTRLGKLTLRDLCAVLAVLLRAGGAEEGEALARAAAPDAAARAIAACFKANLK